jgi:Secreted repeat of unknown function
MITRPDGTKRVTYKSHPIYYFAKDGDAGDAYGAGIKSFGAGWYVLAPSGKRSTTPERSLAARERSALGSRAVKRTSIAA